MGGVLHVNRPRQSDVDLACIDEKERPFLSQVSLPVLCQTTMDHKGCNALVSYGSQFSKVLDNFRLLG